MSFLVKMRLFDPDNRMSLTSLAMFAVLIRLLWLPPSWEILLELLLVLLNYNAKKAFKALSDARLLSENDRIDDLKAELSRVNSELVKLIQASTFKQLGR